MSSYGETALLATIENVNKELQQKRAEVKQGWGKMFQAQGAVRVAEQQARYTAYKVRFLERELDIVVSLYNRNRLEFLSLRLEQLTSQYELAAQRNEFAQKVVRDRRQELRSAHTNLEVPEGELEKLQAYLQKLYALLQQKRNGAPSTNAASARSAS